MKQFDRQYEVLRRIEGNLGRQAEEVAELNRTLSRGVPMGAGATTRDQRADRTSPKGDPFARVKEAAARRTSPAAIGWSRISASSSGASPRWAPSAISTDVRPVAHLGAPGLSRPVHAGISAALRHDWQIKDHSDEYNAYAKPLLAKGRQDRDDIANDPKAPTAIEWSSSSPRA